MKSTLAAAMLIVACAGIGCSATGEPLPNGKTWIKGNGAIYTVHYVMDHDDNLLYAFVIDPSLTLHTTNDAEEPPATGSVHWIRWSRDGLWVFGQKVKVPAEAKVFAIRRDGTIRPIPCTAEQMQAIAPGGGLTDDAFVRDALQPALSKP
jgi:hypothetical protein